MVFCDSVRRSFVFSSCSSRAWPKRVQGNKERKGYARRRVHGEWVANGIRDAYAIHSLVS